MLWVGEELSSGGVDLVYEIGSDAWPYGESNYMCPGMVTLKLCSSPDCSGMVSESSGDGLREWVSK